MPCPLAPAPADALLPSDASAFLVFGGQDVAVTGVGVGVAPAQAGVQGPGLHGVVGVVGVGDGELPQRSEVRLNRVRPRGVGRQPIGVLSFCPARARGGPNPQRAELGERGETRSGKRSGTCSIRSGFVPRSGSGDSFQALMCWRVTPRRASKRWATTGTRFPPSEASSLIARRQRTELVLPRRTTCFGFRPSWSVSLCTRTGSASAPPAVGSDVTAHPTATTTTPANLRGQSTRPCLQSSAVHPDAAERATGCPQVLDLMFG